jgi:hypothetical protein
LQHETDEAKRAMLQRLLVEEEAKLKQLVQPPEGKRA